MREHSHDTVCVVTDERLHSNQAGQMQILRNRYERLLSELSDAQRAEYQQFVLQFADIERQTPHSRRIVNAPPAVVSVKSPEAPRRGVSGDVGSALAPAVAAVMAGPTRRMSSMLTRAVTAPVVSAKEVAVAAALSPDATRKRRPAKRRDWLEADHLKTSLCTLLDDGSVVRVSLVGLGSVNDFVTKRLDAPGLVRVAVVCDAVTRASDPELHFDDNDMVVDAVAPALRISKHSNLPSCDVLFHLQPAEAPLRDASLSQRRLQTRTLVDSALRRALSLAHSVGASTVSVPLLLLSKSETRDILAEDGPAWTEHARSVVACVKEAMLWPDKDPDAFRHARFYLPAELCNDDAIVAQAVELCRAPFRLC